MRVIKTVKQVWRREPEQPSIGAAERKYADFSYILRIVDRSGEAVRMNYLLSRR